MRAGVELRRAHRDEEALAHFTRAYGQTRSPVAQAQMGLAEQALGRWVEAEEHVRRSLEAATDPWILRNREALRGHSLSSNSTWGGSGSTAASLARRSSSMTAR
ncbi:MAG: hypothetical protein IPN17_23025 [Deltaproteobacteria bacterium]|nr:hypothetical protein [Deltaproteobacteria bacterium]